MRLKRIRIEQFRKFSASVEVMGLEQGLNILHGPNEAGKSTIAQALRTLFFERHNTKGDFVTAISPAGNSDAAPSIAADFTLGAHECNAAKTFFQRPRASLTIGGDHWEGGDADERLAERLGFALSKKGVSRADTHGIPGLLWIEQGASANLAEPVDHATSSLEERLKNILGEIASTSGGRLTAALQVELAKMRTATGRTTGVLADVEKSLADTREERDQLQAKADQYRSLSDSLARNVAERDRLDRERPWETYERQKRESEAQKAALEPQLRALEAERQRLREIIASIDSQHEQKESRDKELRTLAAQRDTLAKSTQTHQQSVESLKLAEQRRIKARESLRAARTQHQAAEQRQQRELLQAELERIRAEIKRFDGILAKASQFAVSIGALREQAAATKLSKADLGKLSKLDQALHENRIQREAIATRIAYRLEAGQQIDAGTSGILEGSGSQHITAPVTLHIAGVGEIDIAPGGEDIARLSDEADRLQGELSHQCAKLGVADLAAAEARHTSHRDLEQLIALQEKERDTLLGEHTETEWRDQLADAQGQNNDRGLRLASLPAGEQGASVEEARRAFEDAESDSSTVDAQHEAQQRAVVESELALATLQAHVDSASQRLDSDEARRLAEQNARAFAETVVRRDALQNEVEQVAATIAERKPELIEADIQRYTQALTLVENERRNLRESIGSTRAKLEALGADGLDEKLAAMNIHFEHLEKRLTQYTLRADALSFLKDRLAVHQDAATQRLYAPLRDKLLHYLEILFPGTTLSVNVDALRPTNLSRGGSGLALHDHSHGTREQLGVIARFAYADLLKQAGQPTLLILDDALVHSDSDRRQQMKRILNDASQRHQILLFTCHPEDWRDAGARAMIDVAALSGADHGDR